jgi:hypothetical protein
MLPLQLRREEFRALFYSDLQKSVPVKLARLLLYITIRFCFEGHGRK